MRHLLNDQKQAGSVLCCFHLLGSFFLKGVWLKRMHVLAADNSTDPLDQKAPAQLTEAFSQGLHDTEGQVKDPVLVFTLGEWHHPWRDDMRSTDVRMAWPQSLYGRGESGLIYECGMFL